MAWAKNGTPDTLSSTSDTIDITDQTSTKFNMMMYHFIGSSTITPILQTGNGSLDTGSNYASRYSSNGTTDSTETSASDLDWGFGGSDTTAFGIIYGINISSEEKLFIQFYVYQNTAGASTQPQRSEMVGKWTNTSNQFDYFTVKNVSTGDFQSDSNLSALGTD